MLLALPAIIFLLFPTLFKELGKKPWKTLLIHSGYCTIGLLAFCLILAPMKKLFPKLQILKDLNRYKREIGIAVFIYACMHLTFFITDAIIRKGQLELKVFFHPVIIPGVLAFLVLLALTLTSNDWSIQRLTYIKWKRLHRFIYCAELLVFIHVLLQSVTYALVIFIPLLFIQRLRVKRSIN
ncbi:MAG: ferric reductase-like transmembrane domain-containing protein [Simkaniaceae bacterium]|nr:MAG: ferric reductase-like transmembrane domain-containing protein [Simkaniaceae bacterium]